MNKKIAFIFVNCIIAILAAIFIYNKFFKPESPLVDPDMYIVKKISCNKTYNQPVYLKLNPATICEDGVYQHNKLVKRVTSHIDSKGMRVTPDTYKNKKALTIFGCSYVFGYGLNDNQTFPWQLSEITKRKVYNAALNGGSVQQILLILKSKHFDKEFKNTDLFIYVFLDDHLARLYGPPLSDVKFYYPIAELKNNQIKFVSPSIFYKIGFIAKFLNDKASLKKDKSNKNSKETLDLFIAIVNEIQKTINKEYPNSKFLVFNFDNNQTITKLLRKNNINVIELDDFFNEKDVMKKYLTLEFHPNADFWEKATPLFAKKLNLN